MLKWNGMASKATGLEGWHVKRAGVYSTNGCIIWPVRVTTDLWLKRFSTRPPDGRERNEKRMVKDGIE